MEQNILNLVSDKALIVRIYKEFLQQCKNTTAQFKTKKNHVDISLKKYNQQT